MEQAHFGTDGIRGVVGENLTTTMAYRIGEYVGYSFDKNKTNRVLIGRDTRKSGKELSNSIASGLIKNRCEVYELGVCSTPSLVYLTISEGFDYGVMITASHNPYTDNGIKIITKKGTKLDSSFEKEIEDYIYSNDQITSTNDGVIFDGANLLEKYIGHMCSMYSFDLKKYNILLDCANGSNSDIAQKVFEHFNANVTVINNKPNGENINRDCGSTHLEVIKQTIKQNKFDIGFAFDGDADRVIAISADGGQIDGDKILYCCGNLLKEKGELYGNKIVTTVMANIGLFKALDKCGIAYEVTKVGDKYVYECLQANNYILGGEQSGHIIFSNKATTGDGLLTALEIMNCMVSKNKSIKELTDLVTIYPQLLVNIKVNNKEDALNNAKIKAKCSEVETELKGDGRVLVRASGTEQLIRVMVEASSDDLCAKYCNEIIEVIKKENV